MNIANRKTRRPMLLLVGLVASPAMAAAGFAPGQWEHQTKLQSADIPGIPQWLIKATAGHGSRKSCNSPTQAQRHPRSPSSR